MPTNIEQILYIVDDEPPILDSLRLLMKAVDIKVQTYNSAQAFIDTYTPDQSGCLLLDIRMPIISGLQLQQHLNQQKYALPIIFMTGHGDVSMAVDAIKNGAEDFIQKPFQSDDLLKKIKLAFEKDRQQRSCNENIATAIERLESLTLREREIMEKIINGDANKVIAIDLGISQRTVEIHRAHIMQKMHAKSLAELIKMALVMDHN
jgi:FixJ family two-component response regulator